MNMLKVSRSAGSMAKSNVESGHKAILDSLLLDIPGVVEGKMFGHAAYYVNGKLFACIHGGGVGVKVLEGIANKLLSEQRAVPFQPMDKPKMREWVQINRARSADYRKDIGILRTSVQFVSHLRSVKSRNL